MRVYQEFPYNLLTNREHLKCYTHKCSGRKTNVFRHSHDSTPTPNIIACPSVIDQSPIAKSYSATLVGCCGGGWWMVGLRRLVVINLYTHGLWPTDLRIPNHHKIPPNSPPAYIYTFWIVGGLGLKLGSIVWWGLCQTSNDDATPSDMTISWACS